MIHHIDRLIREEMPWNLFAGIGQEDSFEKQKDAAEGSVKPLGRRKWTQGAG